MKHTHDLRFTCEPLQTEQEALYDKKAETSSLLRRAGEWYRHTEEMGSTWEEAAWGIEGGAGRVRLPVRDARTVDGLDFSVQSGRVLSAVPAQYCSSHLLVQTCLGITIACLYVLAQVLAWHLPPVMHAVSSGSLCLGCLGLRKVFCR